MFVEFLFIPDEVLVNITINHTAKVCPMHRLNICALLRNHSVIGAPVNTVLTYNARMAEISERSNRHAQYQILSFMLCHSEGLKC